MENLNTLHEQDNLIFGREKDELRAYAQMCMLSTLAPMYGSEALFSVTERFNAAIGSGNYMIAFEKSDQDSGIALPVGFITWAKLSRPCEVIFKERLRPLQQAEHNSGSNLWVIDLVAPLGHGVVISQALFTVTGAEQCQATQWREGKWKPKTFNRRKVAAELQGV